MESLGSELELLLSLFLCFSVCYCFSTTVSLPSLLTYTVNTSHDFCPGVSTCVFLPRRPFHFPSELSLISVFLGIGGAGIPWPGWIPI